MKPAGCRHRAHPGSSAGGEFRPGCRVVERFTWTPADRSRTSAFPSVSAECSFRPPRGGRATEPASRGAGHDAAVCLRHLPHFRQAYVSKAPATCAPAEQLSRRRPTGDPLRGQRRAAAPARPSVALAGSTTARLLRVPGGTPSTNTCSRRIHPACSLRLTQGWEEPSGPETPFTSTKSRPRTSMPSRGKP